MYERGDTGNSVAQHRTNSPGALNVKTGVKTREHDSRREHRMSREPPRYYFGEKGITPRMFVSMALKRRVVQLDFSQGAASTKGMLDFLFEDKNAMYCTKLLLERAEQAGETIRRAAHRSRAQAWRSS